MSNKERCFYEFGPFRIDPDHRLLLRENQPLPLQSKAFDVLLTLVQNCERVVSKDDLLKMVWPETFVEESNLAQHVSVLRKTLGDTAGENRYIVTIPGRGYRFAEKVHVVGDGEDQLVVESHSHARLVIEEKTVVALEPAPALPSALSTSSIVSKLGQKWWLWVVGATLLLVTAGIVIRYERQAPPLKEADLVLVSDFVNATGEPILDDTLKQALTVKLAESPYFNVALDAQTRQTLSLMKRSVDERIVPPIAREVCQREGAKALIGGSIVRLGSKYVLDLDATNCLTGDSLAHQRIEAVNQEQVLRSLGQAIIQVRRTLGESLSSIQKFDTPIEQATTKSLPALKAYTEGDQKRAHGQDAESIPFYKMAIDLDPDFAIAYARLGAVYRNLQQRQLSDEYLRKAFERRDHLSERERFYAQAHYYVDSTGETDKAIETYELWTKIYPHDWIPFNNLSNENVRMGSLENAIAAAQEALRLNPNHGFPYSTLVQAYFFSTKFPEAKAVCEKAAAQKLDGWTLHARLYEIALIEEDQTAQRRERDWFSGKPLESSIMDNDAAHTMSLGRVHEANKIYEQARANAVQHDQKEPAWGFLAEQAQFVADLGYGSKARVLAESALATMPPNHKADAALALACAGDVRQAEALGEEASKEKPLDFLMNNVTLLALRATVEMQHGDAAGAIVELQQAAPYDFGSYATGMTAYYRGYAFLRMRSSKEAAAEFQKVLDHRGAASFYWPLAHLGLARAYALSGDTDKSRAAYREFLDLWRDADPDVPLLKEAKAEYAKLQQLDSE
ncbi:MAG TPA: winged helix-turn-helix domain-containing protein [Terriglobales bacterium]|nr:winged helix-turn-helix domain-containing protein [Terriglobales bacterium]